MLFFFFVGAAVRTPLFVPDENGVRLASEGGASWLVTAARSVTSNEVAKSSPHETASFTVLFFFFVGVAVRTPLLPLAKMECA